MDLPPELWDLIFSYFPDKNIKCMAISRLISWYLNDIILNNRHLKNCLFLAEKGMSSSYPIYLFEWACRCGHLGDSVAPRKSSSARFPEVAKWLVSIFNLNAADARNRDNLVLRWACRNGHLEVAEWLVSTFNLTAKDTRSNDNYAFQWACKNGHSKVAEWLINTFDPFKSS